MAQAPTHTQPSSSARTTPAKTAPKAAVPVAEKAAPLNSDEDKAIYALGLSIYRSLSQFQLTAADIKILKQAMLDAANHKPAVDINVFGPKISEVAQNRAKAILDKAAAEPGAVRTPS